MFKRIALILTLSSAAFGQSFPIRVMLAVDSIRTLTQPSILQVIDSMKVNGTLETTGNATFWTATVTTYLTAPYISGNSTVLGNLTVNGTISGDTLGGFPIRMGVALSDTAKLALKSDTATYNATKEFVRLYFPNVADTSKYLESASFGTMASGDSTYWRTTVNARIPYSDTTSSVAMQWELDGKQGIIANLADTSKYAETGQLGSMAYADSAKYHGSASITTVGTIGSGTWQGNAITPTYLASEGSMYYADSAYWRATVNARIPYSDTTSVIAMQWELDGKSAIGHTQAISTVTGLQDSLNAKAQRSEIKSAAYMDSLRVPALDEANTFSQNQTFSGDLAVNGGDITSTSVTLNVGVSGNTIAIPGKLTVDTLTSGVTIQGSLGLTTNSDLSVWGGYTYIYGDELNFHYSENSAQSGYINYRGYGGGITQFRNLIIADGKNATVATFAGSDKSLTLAGDLAVNGGDITTTASTLNIGTSGSGMTVAIPTKLNVDTVNTNLTVTGTLTSTGAISGTTGTFTVSSGYNLILNKTSGAAIQFNKTDATAQAWSLQGEEAAFKLYDETAGTTPLSIAKTTGGATFAGNVLPGTSGNDLGSSSYRWSLFADTVNVSGGVAVGGNVSFSNYSKVFLSISALDSSEQQQYSPNATQWYPVKQWRGTSLTNATLADSQVTVQKAGTYLVTFSADFTAGSGNPTITAALYINEVRQNALASSEVLDNGVAGSSDHSISFNGLVTLAANDIVKVKWVNDTNYTINTDYAQLTLIPVF